MAVLDAHAYYGRTAFFGGMADKASIRKTLGHYGITSAVLLSGLGVDCDFVVGNQMLYEVLDPAAGLYGYVTLNSDYPEESLEEQRRHLGRRAFVAGVLVGRPGSPVKLEDARDILNGQRRYAKPMGILTVDAEGVHCAREIAVQFPSMKFVLLTMGGNDWHTAVTAAKQQLNIYLEISGSMDSDKIAHAAATLTPRKVIYGSGLPFNDPQQTLGLIADTPSLTNFDRNRILSENAQAVFFPQVVTE